MRDFTSNVYLTLPIIREGMWYLSGCYTRDCLGIQFECASGKFTLGCTGWIKSIRSAQYLIGCVNIRRLDLWDLGRWLKAGRNRCVNCTTLMKLCGLTFLLFVCMFHSVKIKAETFSESLHKLSFCINCAVLTYTDITWYVYVFSTINIKIIITINRDRKNRWKILPIVIIRATKIIFSIIIFISDFVV